MARKKVKNLWSKSLTNSNTSYTCRWFQTSSTVCWNRIIAHFFLFLSIYIYYFVFLCFPGAHAKVVVIFENDFSSYTPHTHYTNKRCLIYYVGGGVGVVVVAAAAMMMRVTYPWGEGAGGTKYFDLSMRRCHISRTNSDLLDVRCTRLNLKLSKTRFSPYTFSSREF